MEVCSICHDPMEPQHTVVKPKCQHVFHVICINIWMTRHRSCPLCRRRISVSTQVPWRTLFLTAIIINHEMVLERAAYTCAFLQHSLETYSTKQLWNEFKEYLITKMTRFELSGTRLPFLDLTARATAKKEYIKWRKQFESISGQKVFNAPRIKQAKNMFSQAL